MEITTMPAEFGELGRLSDEYRAERRGEDIAAQYERQKKEGPSQLYVVLSQFSDEQLKQLVGWMSLGRDYDASSGTPSEQLALLIGDAWVSPRDQAIGYVMQKPLSKYLTNAERIMSAH